MRQADIIDHADGQLHSVRIEAPENYMTIVISHLIDAMLNQCSNVTRMHLHGSYGRILRLHFGYLKQLQSLHLIESPFSEFLGSDCDGDELLLPESLKKLHVESVGKLKDDRNWKMERLRN